MADGPSSLANALTSGTIGWVRSDMVLCLVFLALDLGLCELIINIQFESTLQSILKSIGVIILRHNGLSLPMSRVS